MAKCYKIYTAIFAAIIIIACGEQKNNSNEKPNLYPKPLTVKLNIEEGYQVNPLTGDSIEPIINSLGDTIITGKPIHVKGKHIHSDSVSKPKTVKAGTPIVVPAHTNVHKIPEKLTVISLNKDSLKVYYVDSINSDFVLLSSTGDTIPTGFAIPTKGKKVLASQPKPIKALAPRIKDNVINNMQFLDIEQGLVSSYITSVLKDSYGNLWFSTKLSGVCKYDGVSFKHYTVKEGLSYNIVLSMLKDSYGNLWFGTYGGGVNKYDGISFTHYTEKDGLSSNLVRAMLEDSNGNLWFGTEGGGVSKYDGKSFTNYTKKEGLSGNNVWSMLEDEDGNLWFATGEGLSKYDGRSFTHYNEKSGLSSNAVWTILEDKSGNLWFGTGGGGVNKYNGDGFAHYTQKEGLSNNAVTSIIDDDDGNLWFGTWGGGVNKYDGKNFTHYTQKEGLSNNIVTSIIDDDDGNLWFGTYGGGVSKYKGGSFAHYSKNEGLSSNVVLSILEDKRRNLWFGTHGEGVSKYNGENFKHYTIKGGALSGLLGAILEDKDGNLWFGSWGGGVSKYDGKSYTHYTYKEGLSHNYIRSILEDKEGNLWFATWGGVSRFNGKSFTHYTENEGLSNNIVLSMLQDKAGNLWFGTWGGGVSKYNGERFTHYTKKEGLTSNVITSILEDKNENLWFGTGEHGVSKFDGKSFTHYSKKEGLSSNLVLSIQEDKSNRIWVATKSGLSIFVNDTDVLYNTKNEKKLTYKIIEFEKQDGLKGIDFWENSSFLDGQNRIWWGSGKSLTMLDLNKFKLPELIPRIQLNSIEIQQNFIDYPILKEVALSSDSRDNTLPEVYYKELVFDSVARFYNYPLHFELPYKLNHLTFYFSAIDWSAPHQLKYQYKMEGLDNHWSQLSSENRADYRSIPYGKYVFKVRAIGAARIWSGTFEYSFIISPPWWHTWWARILYIFTGLLLIGAYTKWRTVKLKKEQKLLKQKVKERTEEVESQKEELLQQNEEITSQRDQIDLQHQAITDSILYAKRIQTAVLPSQVYIDEILPENFILFKPRDKVSGDFYWIRQINHYKIIAVADCTGHGVPGAIMSMLGISFLNEIVRKREIIQPAEVLNQLRKQIKQALRQTGKKGETSDGMDMALCAFDVKTNRLQYSGANNSLYLIQNGELTEIKADRMPIGYYPNEKPSFTNHEIQLKDGDIFYLFSDGFMDQFGGKKGFKYKVNNFQKLLSETHQKPMLIQKELLEQELENWMKGYEQTDDILVMGVRV